MKESKKTMIITSLLCLAPMILGAVYYGKLPAEMPIHWNAAGEVDGYASKAMAVFGLPLFLFVLEWVMYFVVLNDPKKQNQSKIMRDLGFWSVPSIALVIYPVMIFSALGYDIPIVPIACSLTGLILILCGNYMPKTKQNYTIGIKLPWTLHDPENWYKTHRLASFIWVVCGMVMIGCGFMTKFAVAGLIAVILVATLVPTVYSYMLYRKKQKSA